MQFALLIYHSPEELSMRKNDYADLISAPGGLLQGARRGRSICRRPMRL